MAIIYVAVVVVVVSYDKEFKSICAWSLDVKTDVKKNPNDMPVNDCKNPTTPTEKRVSHGVCQPST